MAGLEHKQLKSPDDALKVCASLLCISKDSVRPFCHVMQELLSCIAKGNYLIQTNDNEPVGFCAWINLNPILGEIYLNDLRWITPMEHNTGNVAWLHFFCANLGNQKSLIEDLRNTVKNNQLAYAANGRKYDLKASKTEDILRLINNG